MTSNYFLHRLEIENFKSYKGKHLVGPFKTFSAIIGPNGSGKSNLMDAICFVLGEKTQNLRVKKLPDLIHGAPISKPVANRAHVTVVFTSIDTGTEKSFTRIIAGAASDYRIDGKNVTAQQYQEELEELGISIKSKNFLVFQGQVETIAMKNAKERTAIFEEMSRSVEFREEYEEAKEAMEKTEAEFQEIVLKRKGVYAQRKEAKMEKDEADRYRQLTQDVADTQIKMHLLQLLFNENEISKADGDLDKKNAELNKQKTRLGKLEATLKEKRSDQGKTSRELTSIEQIMKGVEVDLGQHQPNFIKAKEKTSHAQKKLEQSKKQFATAQKTFESHGKELGVLEQELADVEKQRHAFEQNVLKEAKKRDVKLESDQLREYRRLKDDAATKSTQLQQELDGLAREDRTDRERLNAEQRKKQELLNRIQQKQLEMDENKKRRDKLEEYMKASQQALEEAKQNEAKFEQEIISGRKRYDEITQELDTVVQQLNELSVDQSEISRQARKAELIDTLKSQFPGVYGRLLDLCQPTEKKYQIAVTKVLGRNMDAIVCDTDDTARQCIRYLKDQRIEREVFMPLSYIRPKPINERLREIREPRNVRLLFDVMKHDPSLPVLQKALLFACGNAMVCDDIESARHVAFNLDERQKAVSLDGTLFQKSGVISGGASDLRQKARRWDEKEVTKLRNRKEKLRAELPEVERYRRRDADLATVRSQIQGLQARISFTQQDYNSVTKHISQNEKELEDLRRTLSRDIESKVFEIQRSIDDRQIKTIEPLRQKVYKIEDVVFADFCKKIKVTNIRQYEETQVKEQEELDRKRLEFEELADKLRNQIEFERTKKTKATVDKWTREVKKDEAELETVRKEEEHIKKVIDDLNRKLDGHKNHKNALKTQLSDQERQTEEAQKQVQSQERDVQSTQRSVTVLENRLEQLRADRHMLFKTARLEEIRIPLTKGSFEDVPIGGITSGNMRESSVSSSDQMQVDGSVASSQLDSLSSEDAKRIYEVEAKLEVNYDCLDDEYSDIDTKEEYEKALESLKAILVDQKEQLSKVHAPNLKALERLDDVQGRVTSAEATFEAARKAAKKAQANFEKVKTKRLQRFQACMQHVADSIDDIYKTLARNAGAQAEITADNGDEPYLGGIQYQCIAPGKRYRPMDSLSGGEKTIAALALLFALHSYKPAPFFVLDEIDAALDNTNIAKVTSYIRERGKQTQFIVISLKEEFFCKAQALIGICPVPGNEITTSQVFTLDLTKYPEKSGANASRDH